MISCSSMKSRLFALLLLLTPFVAGADEASQPKTLGSLKLAYDIKRSEFMKPISELQTSYEKQLELLLDQVTAAGNLKGALAVQSEIETYKESPYGNESETFPELDRLRGIYGEAFRTRINLVNEKLEPLAVAYKVELAGLMKQLTQEKKLDEAVKVQTEIETVEALIAEASLPSVGARKQFRVGSPSEALTTDEGKGALAKIVVSGAEWKALQIGALCFSDAEYQWVTVPAELENIQYTVAGKHSHTLTIEVISDGLVFIAVSTRFPTKSGEGDGWEKDALDENGLRRLGWRHLREFEDLSATDSGALMVFYKDCAAGELVTLRTEKYIAPFALTR